MKASNYHKLYDIAYNNSYETNEQVVGDFTKYFSSDAYWSKAFDFGTPIKGRYDIRGVRFMDMNGSTNMYLYGHDKEVIHCRSINDNELEESIIEVAEKTSRMTRETFSAYNPGIACCLEDEDVRTIKRLCPGYYAVFYQDGSMCMKNSIGHFLHMPVNKYDVVQELCYLGKLKGMPHFAYKACDYATPREPEFGMFDLNGHEKYFKDPRLVSPESVREIAKEFRKIVDISKDKDNPRYNDEMLIEIKQRKWNGLKL